MIALRLDSDGDWQLSGISLAAVLDNKTVRKELKTIKESFDRLVDAADSTTETARPIGFIVKEMTGGSSGF